MPQETTERASHRLSDLELDILEEAISGTVLSVGYAADLFWDYDVTGEEIGKALTHLEAEGFVKKTRGSKDFPVEYACFQYKQRWFG